jgi:hypothetical protein
MPGTAPFTHANQRVPIYLREWPIQRVYRSISRRRWVPMLICALVAFCTAAGLSMFRPPLPAVHDEFSFLLSADTLRHGRLANPPHALWEHFETFHVIQQPTYASKFPLGQGAMLALGRLLTGEPLVGVWLSLALASAAVYWMLLAWVPPRWALVGGLVAALRFVCAGDDFLTTYWSQSLWGGALPALGGALALGAARRLARKLRFRHALLLGLGFAVLVHCQPREALLLGVVVMTVVLPGIRRQPVWQGRIVSQLVAPAALALTPAILFLGYANWRATGDPWTSAADVYDRTYNLTPSFLWDRPAAADAKTFRHAAMRDFQELVGGPATGRPLSAVIQTMAERWVQAPIFFLGAAITFCLLLLPLLRRRYWDCLAAAGAAAFVLVESGFAWFFPHSVAAVSGLVLVLGIDSLRCLRTFQWHQQPYGRFASAIVLSITLVITVFPAIESKIARRRYVGFETHRARMISDLTQSAERHLIIVEYQPGHVPHDEWVYNEADIDQAPVVWARDMGPEQNRRLIEYFKSRRVWELSVKDELHELRPYHDGNVSN